MKIYDGIHFIIFDFDCEPMNKDMLEQMKNKLMKKKQTETAKDNEQQHPKKEEPAVIEQKNHTDNGEKIAREDQPEKVAPVVESGLSKMEMMRERLRQKAMTKITSQTAGTQTVVPVSVLQPEAQNKPEHKEQALAEPEKQVYPQENSYQDAEVIKDLVVNQVIEENNQQAQPEPKKDESVQAEKPHIENEKQPAEEIVQQLPVQAIASQQVLQQPREPQQIQKEAVQIEQPEALSQKNEPVQEQAKVEKQAEPKENLMNKMLQKMRMMRELKSQAAAKPQPEEQKEVQQAERFEQEQQRQQQEQQVAQQKEQQEVQSKQAPIIGCKLYRKQRKILLKQIEAINRFTTQVRLFLDSTQYDPMYPKQSSRPLWQVTERVKKLLQHPPIPHF